MISSLLVNGLTEHRQMLTLFQHKRSILCLKGAPFHVCTNACVSMTLWCTEHTERHDQLHQVLLALQACLHQGNDDA